MVFVGGVLMQKRVATGSRRGGYSPHGSMAGLTVRLREKRAARELDLPGGDTGISSAFCETTHGSGYGRPAPTGRGGGVGPPGRDRLADQRAECTTPRRKEKSVERGRIRACNRRALLRACVSASAPGHSGTSIVPPRAQIILPRRAGVRAERRFWQRNGASGWMVAASHGYDASQA